MLPTFATAHIDAFITNMSIAYVQAPSGFVADRAMPILGVKNRSNKYPIFSKADFMRDDAKVRAPGTAAAGGGFRMSDDTYSCLEYAYAYELPDELKANWDASLSADRAAVALLNQKLQIRRERAFSTDFMATSVWANTDQTGSATVASANGFLQWNDAASIPIEDIQKQAGVIQLACGFLPNKMVMGWPVFNALRNHPDVIDRVKHVMKGVITEEILASLLGLEEVLVAKSIYNSAAEAADATMARIIDKTALLMFTNPAPAQDQPSAGYTFSWTQFDHIQQLASSGAMGVRTYRVEERGVDRYEGKSNFDQKAVDTGAAVFFTGAVA